MIVSQPVDLVSSTFLCCGYHFIAWIESPVLYPVPFSYIKYIFVCVMSKWGEIMNIVMATIAL